MIAPDSNRSATARSITTRSPLTVEEVEFGDGDVGFATDGTPVDCVRFADLGPGRGAARPDRLGDQPRRQPRRRHHLLGHGRGGVRGDRARHPGGGGLPAILAARDGLRRAAASTSAVAAPFRGASWCGALHRRADAGGDADQRQLPGRRADGGRGDPARQAHLQRRAEAGRRGRRTGAATRSTAASPRYEEIEGTDLYGGRPGPDLGDADPLRPHRPRRPRDAARLGPRGDARPPAPDSA